MNNLEEKSTITCSVPVALTNAQLASMLDTLMPLLDNIDIVGYAAARNIKLIKNECAEFLALRDQLINELGEPELDESGNDTGIRFIALSSPGFETFKTKLEEIATIKHDFTPFTIPIKKAIGKISGSQMLALDWMFTEDD